VSDVDTTNDFLVSMRRGGEEILLLYPPVTPMTREEALRLAAWLVAIADFEGERFPAVLEAVLNT